MNQVTQRLAELDNQVLWRFLSAYRSKANLNGNLGSMGTWEDVASLEFREATRFVQGKLTCEHKLIKKVQSFYMCVISFNMTPAFKLQINLKLCFHCVKNIM